MKWIPIVALFLLTTLPAQAAFYDTAYLQRLLDRCEALPETFEANKDNFDRIKDCGLSTGYILGVYDTLHVMADRSLCLPATLPTAQAVSAVYTWVQNHPDQASSPAEQSIRSALKEAWSCTD